MEKLGAVADGAAEDLIRAFVQIGCAEGHTKTLIEKYSAELTNGIVDASDDKAVKAHIELIDDSMEELERLAEIRRSTM